MNTHTTLTPDEQDFQAALLEKLPPIIARHQVDRYLGGVVSPNTLKNHDLAGTGPARPWRVGRKVAYSAADLVTWLIKAQGVSRLQGAIFGGV